MKIARTYPAAATLAEFVDRHDLTISMHQRLLDVYTSRLPRFWCRINNAEIMDAGLLSSATGDGDTEEAALDDLRRHLSRRRIAIGAYTPQRREIVVPELVGVGV